MKILLLGARGRLGKELLRSLAPQGEIIACARSIAARSPDKPDRLAWRAADVASPDQLRALVGDVRPTLIVNAAAYTAVEAAEREPLVAEAVNGTAPGVLAEAALCCGAALIHYSTDYVFDGTGERPWPEDAPTGPLNVYGQTKLAGEEAIRNSGVSHLIVRTSWLYSIVGQSFARKMLELAVHEHEIEMVSDQVGAPTSARFVADATAGILGQSAGNPSALLRQRGGTLHVVCAGETNWYAFANEIFEQSRHLGGSLSTPIVRPIRSTDRPRALARPLNSRLDTSRLRERFGVVPPSWDGEFRAHFPRLLDAFLQEAEGSR